ncbi:MAG: hypothetical protein V1495_06970 [Pseudomonadota bacterium]
MPGDDQDGRDRKRKAVVSWLCKQNAEHLSELYRAAVVLFDNESFPGRFRLIAHAVREIRNRLPDILSQVENSERFEVSKRVSHLVKTWDNLRVSELPTSDPVAGDNNGEKPGTVAIPTPVFQVAAALVDDFRKVTNKKEESARRLFMALIPHTERNRELMAPVIRQWVDVTEWFAIRAHETVRAHTQPSEGDLRSNFLVFEDTLMSLQSNFFENLGEVNDILEQANRTRS